MQFNQPMFVLQRRINQPLEAVERVLCDPAATRASSTHWATAWTSRSSGPSA